MTEVLTPLPISTPSSLVIQARGHYLLLKISCPATAGEKPAWMANRLIVAMQSAEA